jgi:hypothetical protein
VIKYIKWDLICSLARWCKNNLFGIRKRSCLYAEAALFQRRLVASYILQCSSK